MTYIRKEQLILHLSLKNAFLHRFKIDHSICPLNLKIVYLSSYPYQSPRLYFVSEVRHSAKVEHQPVVYGGGTRLLPGDLPSLERENTTVGLPSTHRRVSRAIDESRKSIRFGLVPSRGVYRDGATVHPKIL